MNEVKRQAMDEVQKAVAEAEQKAFEMIASERAKMEKTLADAKKKAQEDAIMVINEQEDSSEVSRAIDGGDSTVSCSHSAALKRACIHDYLFLHLSYN